MARLALAAGAASVARSDRSPVVLASAAELFASVNVRPLGIAPRSQSEAGPVSRPGAGPGASTGALPEPGRDAGGAPAASPGGEGLSAEGAVRVPAPPDDPAALFAEAASMARAASDEGLAEAIDGYASPDVTRRPKRGYGGRYDGTVEPRSSHVFTIPYEASSLARVSLSSSVGQGLELTVRAASDSEAGCSRGAGGEEGTLVCTWVPASEGDYLVRVRNTTDVYVGYVVYTN